TTDGSNLSLLPLAHAPAVLQGPHVRRIQAALDPYARLEGLLRHGAHLERLSPDSPDLQHGAFHDGSGGRIRRRRGRGSLVSAGLEDRRDPQRRGQSVFAPALFLSRSPPHDLPLSALWRAVQYLAGAKRLGVA